MDKVGRGHNKSSGPTFLLKYHPRLHCPFRRMRLHPEALPAPLCLVGQHLYRQLSSKALQANTRHPRNPVLLAAEVISSGMRYLL